MSAELTDVAPPKEQTLSARFSLSEIESLSPEFRDELANKHGLEVRIMSRSPKVQELLDRAGLRAKSPEAMYDKVYDRTTPGYDRTYDRGA